MPHVRPASSSLPATVGTYGTGDFRHGPSPFLLGMQEGSLMSFSVVGSYHCALRLESHPQPGPAGGASEAWVGLLPTNPSSVWAKKSRWAPQDGTMSREKKWSEIAPSRASLASDGIWRGL